MRNFARAVAASRILFSIAWLASPSRVNSSWLGGIAREKPTDVLSRSVAARDLAMGVGALVAINNGRGSSWMAAHAVADVVDLASTVALRQHLPAKGVRQTVIVAGASALACATSAVALMSD
jgi:hypothetical protein